MKNIWEFQTYDTEAAQKISEELGLSIIVARLLVQRQVNNVDEARDFLNAGLEKLSDPWSLQGIAAAVDRIKKALELKHKVVIYGDYDVDGVCSIVILKECLEYLGGQVDYYVPNRFGEGYGLNGPALEALANQGCQLLITVDCGINSVVETELAARLGIDVIITDHHTPSDKQPPALAVINPKNDCHKATLNLAGAGVAFKLACALAQGTEIEQKMESWLDLVALATIADIVPLIDENRILVKYGLKVLEKSKRPGLRELINFTGLTGKAIQSWQVGYVLAPRLNSAGRLKSARTSVELLSCSDEAEAQTKAAWLCKLNDERRMVEEGIFLEALQQLQNDTSLTDAAVMVLGGEEWHLGVIGIVASRLTELYNRPVVVISWSGGVGKGSARSTGDFNLYQALHHSRDFLLEFGGHKMAAGLSINKDQVTLFKDALQNYAGSILVKQQSKRYRIDMEIEEQDIEQKLLDEIDLLGPFGEGNPIPHFVLTAGEISNPVWVGSSKSHLKFRTGATLEAIAFNRSDLSDYPLRNCSHDLLFELGKNDFGGKTKIQLRIKDVRSAYTRYNREAEASNAAQLSNALHRAVGELSAGCPVVFLYPSFRCLQKHQGMMEYLFNPANVQPLHGHLEVKERLLLQDRFTRGKGLAWLMTSSFFQYFLDNWPCPSNLNYIVKMWPLKEDSAFNFRESVQVEVIKQTDLALVSQTMGMSDDNHRMLIYTNLAQTIQGLKHKYPEALVESGVRDMRTRRRTRSRYANGGSKVLMSDGTHTAGVPFINGIDRILLADSPLGYYELAAMTDYLPPNPKPQIEIGFNRAGLERNRKYLNSLYPEMDLISSVSDYCRLHQARLSRVNRESLATAISAKLGKEHSRLEILSAIRILADLGLCEPQKSGSIMAINSEDTVSLAAAIANLPYFLEGVAEKEVFADWENKLNNWLVW